jgi:hypothetical protein
MSVLPDRKTGPAKRRYDCCMNAIMAGSNPHSLAALSRLKRSVAAMSNPEQ